MSKVVQITASIITLLLVTSLLCSQSLVINEIMSDNETVLRDYQEDYPDWIELYNAGASAVNLGGFYLSDNPNNIQKWQIPVGTNIAAGAHLVFLADGDDTFADGYNHTSFKLTQTKGTEHIVFTDPSGAIIESIALDYPNKKNDRNDFRWLLAYSLKTLKNRFMISLLLGARCTALLLRGG